MDQFIEITIDVEYKDFVSKLAKIEIKDNNFIEFRNIIGIENVHKCLLDKKQTRFVHLY